jgi:hypothetical protein
METRHWILSILSAVALASPHSEAFAAGNCGQNEICGLKNAEDIVRVGSTRFAVVGRLAKDPEVAGGFSLLDWTRKLLAY